MLFSECNSGASLSNNCRSLDTKELPSLSGTGMINAMSQPSISYPLSRVDESSHVLATYFSYPLSRVVESSHVLATYFSYLLSRVDESSHVLATYFSYPLFRVDESSHVLAAYFS